MLWILWTTWWHIPADTSHVYSSIYLSEARPVAVEVPDLRGWKTPAVLAGCAAHCRLPYSCCALLEAGLPRRLCPWPVNVMWGRCWKCSQAHGWGNLGVGLCVAQATAAGLWLQLGSAACEPATWSWACDSGFNFFTVFRSLIEGTKWKFNLIQKGKFY